MNKLTHKLRSQRGETLVEVLAALIVIALSVTVFATALSLSSTLNRRQADAQQQLYDEVAQAQSGEGTASQGTLTFEGDIAAIPSQSIEITGDGVKAYRGR